ncbi:MAG: hypothetical protein H7Y18_01345 [Clostridiaceae bacterium]|nr:hypothetical protein [Clostridiaceae bacterium]
MNIKPKIKIFLLRIMMKTPNVVLTISGVVLAALLIAMFFIIPIFEKCYSTSY